MADVPYHTHTFELPTATAQEVAEAFDTDKVVTPASLVNVSDHVASKDNPHEVTAAQVGTLDAAEIAAALALQVSVEAQTLTLTQKTQAQVNIGALGASITSKSADYTVVAADSGVVISMDASGAARTVTLPPAATAGTGFKVAIKKSDSSYNTVTIDGDGSETIDGETTKVLRLPRQSASLICDGTGWHVFEEAGTEFYGSNANGEYVRHADGKQICWSSPISTVTPLSTVTGVLYSSTAANSWTFPAAFVAGSLPSVQTGGANSATTILVAGVADSGLSATTRAFIPFSSPSTFTYRVSAIGRWF